MPSQAGAPARGTCAKGSRRSSGNARAADTEPTAAQARSGGTHQGGSGDAVSQQRNPEGERSAQCQRLLPTSNSWAI